MNLILAATEMEIKFFKNKFNNENFLCTKIGIGIVNSMYNTLKILESVNYKVSKVILVGIGGGFKSKVSLLDTCFATKEILGDFGICFNGYIEKIEDNEIDLSTVQLIEDFNVKKGKFITVNCVTTNKSVIDFFEKKYSPVCENMEGYAVAYICKKKNIDFLEIRTISNWVGERENWKIEEAVEKLNETAGKIIKEICKS